MEDIFKRRFLDLLRKSLKIILESDDIEIAVRAELENIDRELEGLA